MNKYLEIVSYSDGSILKRLDVTNYQPRQIEKIVRGMSINLNHNLFYISELKTDNKLQTI